MTKSLAPAIKELESAYDQLQAQLLDKHMQPKSYDYKKGGYISIDVPKPIITIQAQKRRANAKPVHGWYKAGSWHSESEDAIGILAGTVAAGEHVESAEINLTPDSLDRTKVELLTTLVHQMIHHYAATGGYHTINQNSYHNSWFQSYASRLGFDVEVDGSHGYSKITPRAQLTKTLEGIQLNEAAFDLVRKSESSTAFTGSKLKKWSCGCTNIRVATYLEAVCNHCGNEFVYEDKDKEDVTPYLNQMDYNHKNYRTECQKYH